MVIRRLFVLCAAVLWTAAPASAQQPLVLLAPAAGATQTASPGVVRQRRVAMPGAAQLMSPAASQELLLDLFPDVTLRAVRQRLEPTANGMSWVGTVSGYPMSDAIFVQVGNEIIGNVYTPFGLFHIARDGTGYSVQHIDGSGATYENDAVIADQPAVATAADAALAPALAGPDNGRLIDVLVVYTPDALAGWGDETKARAAIDFVVAEANRAFENSAVNFAVRLVGAQMIQYVETGSSGVDLARLQSPNDGFMDDVHALRNQVAADLVVLITERMTDAGGRGYLNNLRSSPATGFSIIARITTGSGRAFAHELGHNLGAHHDWFVEAGAGAFPYSKGYTSVAGRFHDLMAYTNHCGHLGLRCAQALQFSNPRIERDGHRTGIAEGTRLGCQPGDPAVECDADAADTLNRMAAHVARFRQGSASIMSGDQQLGPNETLLSPNGAFRLVYQGDGNVVLYNVSIGTPVWATHTSGSRPGALLMQADGNLVLYDGDGRPRWASSTSSRFAYLMLQNDGNLVIYSANGPPVWDRFSR